MCRMDSIHRELLRGLRVELCSHAVADGLVPQYLFQEGIITREQLEDICGQATSQRRAMRLLDILPTRGPKAFDVFLASLAEFPWVQENLKLRCPTRPPPVPALPANLLQNCPNDRQLNLLAGKLGAEWEQVLGHLGLEHSDLYRCKVQHPGNLHSQVLEGLVKWKQHMGRKATVQRLWEALEAAEMDPSEIKLILQ
ncbi:death domain-containing protein CRADD-like isoform X1 [Rana temporaria]|uniref:death domain-containing protein CRADD-like isoform X1 n=2 Tax=Rana temporaria TaxID=8407 RepID=UPI001AAC8571|nr:death domain-containing protein CRADD-like isoform X1 [Rana temporaria]